MSHTITIMTRDFGEITAEQNQLIHFPQGLFAFAEEKEFVLMSPLGDNTYPMWLQSAAHPTPCFIVFDPLELLEDYAQSEPLPQEALDLLELKNMEDLAMLVIAVVPEDYLETTANLKSPILINRANRQAIQVILDQDYSLRFPLFRQDASSAPSSDREGGR